MGRIKDWWYRWKQNRRTQQAVKGKKPFGRLEPDKKPAGEVSVKSEGKAAIRARVIRADGTIEDLGVVAGNPNIEPI